MSRGCSTQLLKRVHRCLPWKRGWRYWSIESQQHSTWMSQEVFSSPTRSSFPSWWPLASIETVWKSMNSCGAPCLEGRVSLINKFSQRIQTPQSFRSWAGTSHSTWRHWFLRNSKDSANISMRIWHSGRTTRQLMSLRMNLCPNHTMSRWTSLRSYWFWKYSDRRSYRSPSQTMWLWS